MEPTAVTQIESCHIERVPFLPGSSGLKGLIVVSETEGVGLVDKLEIMCRVGNNQNGSGYIKL